MRSSDQVQSKARRCKRRLSLQNAHVTMKSIPTKNQPPRRRVKLSDVDFRDSLGEYRRGSTCFRMSATLVEIAEGNAQMLKSELDLNAHLHAQLDAEFHDQYRDLI